MTAKEILEQLINDEITPDEALDDLDELEDLSWSDAIFDWGFIVDDNVSIALKDHANGDFQWLKNFLEDLNPEQEWHYVNGYGWCDDTNFKDTVIDFINDHMEEE